MSQKDSISMALDSLKEDVELELAVRAVGGNSVVPLSPLEEVNRMFSLEKLKKKLKRKFSRRQRSKEKNSVLNFSVSI